MKDACELSRWLPARARGAGFCRQRDSEAAGWDTRRSYISMNRAVGRGVARGDGGDPIAEGHAAAGNGKWGGFEYNCSCVLSGKHSFMPIPPRSRQFISDSPPVERNGRLCDEMAKGKSRQTAV